MDFPNYHYNFPPVRESLYEGTDEQTRHIMDEAAEALDARCSGGITFLMELWDVVHAVETELHHHQDKDVRSAYTAVVEKNAKRNYYDDRWSVTVSKQEVGRE